MARPDFRNVNEYIARYPDHMRPTLRLRVAVPTRKDKQHQQDDGFH